MKEGSSAGEETETERMKRDIPGNTNVTQVDRLGPMGGGRVLGIELVQTSKEIVR